MLLADNGIQDITLVSTNAPGPYAVAVAVVLLVALAVLVAMIVVLVVWECRNTARRRAAGRAVLHEHYVQHMENDRLIARASALTATVDSVSTNRVAP